jgi:hypothetical protein
MSIPVRVRVVVRRNMVYCVIKYPTDRLRGFTEEMVI